MAVAKANVPSRTLEMHGRIAGLTNVMSSYGVYLTKEKRDGHEVVVFTRVHRQSLAHGAGIRNGDVLHKVYGVPVGDAILGALVDKIKSLPSLLLQIKRPSKKCSELDTLNIFVELGIDGTAPAQKKLIIALNTSIKDLVPWTPLARYVGSEPGLIIWEVPSPNQNQKFLSINGPDIVFLPNSAQGEFQIMRYVEIENGDDDSEDECRDSANEQKQEGQDAENDGGNSPATHFILAQPRAPGENGNSDHVGIFVGGNQQLTLKPLNWDYFTTGPVPMDGYFFNAIEMLGGFAIQSSQEPEWFLNKADESDKAVMKQERFPFIINPVADNEGNTEKKSSFKIFKGCC